MEYNLDELFLKIRKAQPEALVDDSLQKIEEYIQWDKPDFVGLIAPHHEDPFPFQRNLRLNFQDKEESLETIIQHILPSQIEVINQIDLRTIQFLFEAYSQPMDLLLKLRFNVELKPGVIQTFLRKIHIVVVDSEGKPEIGLTGVTDITQLAPSQKVLFELKVNEGANIDETLVETFLSDIEKLLDHKVRLTKREMEILEQIELGKTSLEIADILNIAKTTVDTHRQNMLKKYDVPNITALIHEVKSMGNT